MIAQPIPTATRLAIIEESDANAPRPLWRAHTVALSTGGEAHGDFAAESLALKLEDVRPGSLYFAKGEPDGAAAFKRGAAGMVSTVPVNAPHVLVADRDAALTRLAAAARNRARATIIALAGFDTRPDIPGALHGALGQASRGLAWSADMDHGLEAGLAGMAADRSYALFGLDGVTNVAPLRPHMMVGGPALESELGCRIAATLGEGGAAVLPADHCDFARWRATALDNGAQVYGFGRKASADIRLLDTVAVAGGALLITAELMGTRLCYSLPHGGIGASASLSIFGAMRAAGASLGAAALALSGSCRDEAIAATG